ncbi:unnamed protein product [Trifolium pratense]|uniref:Uncharacterized protein n=1 Tax=Trifolium pratense TaxID=57577 RepID=A0ACB0K702_TRIPR|nr:unnamed protein product [Trifolium pratense]
MPNPTRPIKIFICRHSILKTVVLTSLLGLCPINKFCNIILEQINEEAYITKVQLLLIQTVINAFKEKVSQIDVLKEQFEFLMQMQNVRKRIAWNSLSFGSCLGDLDIRIGE